MTTQQTTTEFDYEQIPLGYYDDIFHRRQGVQSQWHVMKFDYFRKRMGSYQHHLDIGCGPGTFIGTLDPQKKSTGLDISTQQISYAQKKYGSANHQFKSTKPGPLPFNDNEFDVVTSVELIEHLTMDENKKLLTEAVRVLKPGGRLLISTPNYRSFWPFIEMMVNRLGKVSYEDQHITHFNRKRLKNLFTSLGLTEVRVNGFQFSAPFFSAIHWNCSGWIDKIEPRWFVSLLGSLLFGEGVKSHAH